MEKKNISILLVFLLTALFFCRIAAVSAQDSENSAPSGDDLTEVKMTVTAGGKEMNVTAVSGLMAMDTDLGTYEIFFTAYTADDVEDPSQRPVTFAFNGGPGSASYWLHLGLLGPQRLDLSPEGMVEKVPAGIKENEYSLLDMTDLVFIDPVGTGYSRAAGEIKNAVFYSYEHDNKSIGDFIRQYLVRYDRMSSPKYLIGESYGTTRAVGVCSYLEQQWIINLNGLILVSSANDFTELSFAAGNDIPYVNFLPTFAAAARYHQKADEKYLDMKLEDFLDEVRSFAAGDYLPALYQGSRLTEEQREDIAERMAGYIGLPADLILKNNLRINSVTFLSELLGDRKLMVGRYDSRYTGPVTGGENDPSSNGVDEAYIAAYLDYVSRTLGYKTDRPYYGLAWDVGEQWQFGSDNSFLAQEEVIRDILSRNKFLKIWVLCGYYDAATPFFGSEWVYSHVFEDEELKENVSFTYYPAGHMFYLIDDCLAQFRQDAEAWFRGER